MQFLNTLLTVTKMRASFRARFFKLTRQRKNWVSYKYFDGFQPFWRKPRDKDHASGP